MENIEVAPNGQLTLPMNICQELGVDNGGNLGIKKNKNGEYVLISAYQAAFAEIRESMAGEAEKVGLHSIEDIVALVK